MKHLLFLALIAQLAVQLAFALPILNPHSVEFNDGMLYRRADGFGWLHPRALKITTAESEAKVSAETATAQSSEAPAQHAPAQAEASAPPATPEPQNPTPPISSQSTVPQTQAHDPQSATTSTSQLPSHLERLHEASRALVIEEMSVKEKNRLMSNAYKFRAGQEVTKSVDASRRIMGITGNAMSKHSRLALHNLQRGNMRQTYHNAKVAAQSGLIGTAASTVTLVNGLRYGARARGTALKYKVKQWNGSKYTNTRYDPDIVRSNADHVRDNLPGFQQSGSLVNKMLYRPPPPLRPAPVVSQTTSDIPIRVPAASQTVVRVPIGQMQYYHAPNFPMQGHDIIRYANALHP